MREGSKELAHGRFERRALIMSTLTFVGFGRSTLELCEELGTSYCFEYYSFAHIKLGISSQVTPASAEHGHKRFLLIDGRIQSLPNGPVEALMNPLTRRALPGILNDLR